MFKVTLYNWITERRETYHALRIDTRPGVQEDLIEVRLHGERTAPFLFLRVISRWMPERSCASRAPRPSATMNRVVSVERIFVTDRGFQVEEVAP